MAPKYEIIIYWSQQDEAYVAEVPELPGCAADGKTYREALADVEMIIQEWIETAKELGRPIPAPQRPLGFRLTRMRKSQSLMPPVHPGEILREDFMKPLALTVNKLALELHVPATRIGEIVNQRRRITAETALRLARFFHTNAEFWLNLQSFYDLEVTRRSGKVSEIERQVHPTPLALVS